MVDPFARLETPRLCLWVAPPTAAPALVDFFTRNREHLATWSPPYPEDFYTPGHWQEQLTRERQEFLDGTSLKLKFFAREAPGGPVLGYCSFSQIVRGPFQACYLGYALDSASVGRGLMSEALTASIAYLFSTFRLHRIMANYLPVNERSGRLLQRLGFVVEGYAREYLYINGAWRDHILTALTNPQMRTPAF